MFDVNSTFGSSLIIWDFWTWKTYWVENIVYQAKDKNPDDICLISNIPNSITDILYNSPDDLRTILEFMFRFFIETNANIEKYNKTFRDIILVIDEAQLYFPQDWTSLSWDKELLQKLRVILTQCRKRNVKLYLCTQRWKTVNINVRRYTDYIYMYNMQHFFDNPKFKKNTLEIYKCGWGVSDLLWEDWVSWQDLESLDKDRLDTITMEYNTFLLQSAYKLKHYDWNLWKEKHLTQYICGLPWDYLEITTYDEFKQKLVYWWLEEDKKFRQVYNQDNIPLFVRDMYFYANRDELQQRQFISCY